MSGHDVARFLLPIGGLLTLIGYFGPWVDHPVAGLVIMGLDLGEYVKFLEPVRSGAVTIWRAGFYLPLLAVSLIFSLHAFDAQLRYGWPMRAVLLGIAIVAALNMLPPAWTPHVLRTPAFRVQVVAIAGCLGAMLISPFLALIPHHIRSLLALLLALGASWWPLRDFLRTLPAIRAVYNQPLTAGWGVYVMIGGLGILIIFSIGIMRNATWHSDQPTTESAGGH